MGQGLQQSYENYGDFINNSTMNFMMLYKEDLNA